MPKDEPSDQNVLEKFGFAPVGMIVLQPTPFCNLDCDYCYLPDRQSKNQLSLDVLTAIFDKIFAVNFLEKNLTVAWHAGEPLSVPISFYEKAFEIIETLKEKFNLSSLRITHTLQTNGTLINQSWCDLFKKYDVKVGVSIDGPEFIHDAHRKTRTGLGTFGATMRGISWLQKNDIVFSVICVLTALSLEHGDEILKFFVDQDIKYIGLNVEEIEGNHQTSGLNDRSLEVKYRDFMKSMYQFSKANVNKIHLREFEQAEFFIREQKDIKKGQSSPFLMLNIAYNGDFSTFSPELLSMDSKTYGDFILGNFLTDTLESVVETEKFKKIYQDIQAGVDLCEETCDYFSVCGGGAPANKYFENGSFATSETMYCRYTKQIIADIVLEDLEKSLGLV
jgi:uncharacterized protein